MPCVPGTKRPSCPDDLGPLNPGGVGFMERGAPTCHEAGEKGVPESRTQGRMDSGVRGGSYSLIASKASCSELYTIPCALNSTTPFDKTIMDMVVPSHLCFNDSLNPGCGDSRSPALMGYRAGKEPCSRVTGCRAL